MKRALALIAAVLVVIALAVLLLGEAPRRPRPTGYRDEWAQLPLVAEGEWAIDAAKRAVVQGEFFLATDELGHCVQKYGGSGETFTLELLVETEEGGTHFEYVETDPNHPERSRGTDSLLACVTRTLESTSPLPTPGLPEGTRWRLAVDFLVPPLSELPKVPWWKRFIPERWRSGPSSSHIG